MERSAACRGWAPLLKREAQCTGSDRANGVHDAFPNPT